MLKELGFTRGVNLGGWFSQCDYSDERLDHFIEEEDFARIASWGLDHVRLPIDYNVLEKEDASIWEDREAIFPARFLAPEERSSEKCEAKRSISSFKPEGFARVERAIGLARKHGLNIILDLHKTAGYSFDVGEKEKGFFAERSLQERFYRLWEEIARHFGNDPDHVAFELLNEVTDRSVIGEWNRIANTCIAGIRRFAKDTIILVGSHTWNNVRAVRDLDKPYDDRVVYNFHCYDPLEFTHQGAHWAVNIDREKRISFAEEGLTPQYYEDLFADAVKKAKECNTELYCGEYGVIETVAPEDVLRWYETIHAVFEKYGIGRAAWSYRQMNFGLADARMDGVRDRLVKVL